MELRFAKWEVWSIPSARQTHGHALIEWPQNGKQGENKNLAEALEKAHGDAPQQ